MTNDQNALAAELDRIAADTARLAGFARQLGRPGEGMGGFCLFLTVVEAVEVCGVTDQTIYNWIDDAKRMGIPFAEKRANVWLIVTADLLAFIQKQRGGLPARVKAENRLRECSAKWSEPQELRSGEAGRAPE